jgi:Male enhanced antigen 1 (MEA1)
MNDWPVGGITQLVPSGSSDSGPYQTRTLADVPGERHTREPFGDPFTGPLDELSRRYIRQLAVGAAADLAPSAARAADGGARYEEPAPPLQTSSRSSNDDPAGFGGVDEGEGTEGRSASIAEGAEGSSRGLREGTLGTEDAMQMTAERRTAVLAAMKNFSLPYFPAWAVHVPEEQWVDALRNRTGVLGPLQDSTGLAEGASEQEG